MELRERFEAKLIPEPNSGCWLWLAATDDKGYGRLRRGSQSDGSRHMALAHRVAWELYVGPIPDGLNPLHKCDVRCCVNYQHLFLGTQIDNMRDCAAKGRTSQGERHSAIQKANALRGVDHPRHGVHQNVGSENAAAKLTESQVRAIRNDARSLMAVSADYGVSIATVSAIRLRKRWAHLD